MKEISPNELNNPEKPGDGWYIIEAAGQHPHGVRLHWLGGDVRATGQRSAELLRMRDVAMEGFLR